MTNIKRANDFEVWRIQMGNFDKPWNLKEKKNKHKNPTSFDNVKVTYFQVMDICTDNFTLLQTVQSNTHGN